MAEIYLVFDRHNPFNPRDFSCAVIADSADEALQLSVPYITAPNADAEEIAEDLEGHVAEPLANYMVDILMQGVRR